MATVGTSVEITLAEEKLMTEKNAAACKHSEILKNESRHEILNEFEDLGVNPNALSPLSIDELAVLLSSVKNMAASPPNKAGKPKSKCESGQVLSKSDKTILRRLVSSSGYTSSQVLSRELEIPMTTVQRRRKRLESDLVERNYLLKAERLGWRTATLYVTSENGSTVAIGITESWKLSCSSLLVAACTFIAGLASSRPTAKPKKMIPETGMPFPFMLDYSPQILLCSILIVSF